MSGSAELSLINTLWNGWRSETNWKPVGGETQDVFVVQMSQASMDQLKACDRWAKRRINHWNWEAATEGFNWKKPKSYQKLGISVLKLKSKKLFAKVQKCGSPRSLLFFSPDIARATNTLPLKFILAQLVRGLRRTINHGITFWAHGLAWIVLSQACSKLHRDLFLATTLTAAGGAFVLSWVNYRRSVVGDSDRLRDPFGDLREKVNIDWKVPAVLAMIAIGLHVMERNGMEVKRYSWMFALPVAAVYGHYFGAELRSC